MRIIEGYNFPEFQNFYVTLILKGCIHDEQGWCNIEGYNLSYHILKRRADYLEGKRQ